MVPQVRQLALHRVSDYVGRIHVVNHPRMFNILYSMIKPFLNDRVRDNIVFHGSDLASLHSEVSPALLPADLGWVLG